MRQLTLLAAILVIVLMAAVPAIAQVGQENEQEAESGDSNQTFTASSEAPSANQCAAILAAAQSGNGANSGNVMQSDGRDNKVEVQDSGALTINPELTEECEQIVNQAAAATAPKPEASKATPKAAPAPPKAEAKGATSQAKGENPQAKETTATRAESKATEKKELPKTGGDVRPLFALGLGILLVVAGLLARKITTG